jgi:hypothetical protein
MVMGNGIQFSQKHGPVNRKMQPKVYVGHPRVSIEFGEADNLRSAPVPGAAMSSGWRNK